jgi:hypothetical protein
MTGLERATQATFKIHEMQQQQAFHKISKFDDIK